MQDHEVAAKQIIRQVQRNLALMASIHHRFYVLTCCLLLCIVTTAAPPQTVIDSIKQSLYQPPASDHFAAYLFLAKHYWRKEPNKDSCSYYLSLANDEANRTQDTSQLIQALEFSGVRAYYDDRIKEALEDVEKVKNLSKAVKDTSQLAKALLRQAVISTNQISTDQYHALLQEAATLAEHIKDYATQLACADATLQNLNRLGMHQQAMELVDNAYANWDKLGAHAQLRLIRMATRTYGEYLIMNPTNDSIRNRNQVLLAQGIALADEAGDIIDQANMRMSAVVANEHNPGPSAAQTLQYGREVVALGHKSDDPFFLMSGTQAMMEGLKELGRVDEAWALHTELLEYLKILRRPMSNRGGYRVIGEIAEARKDFEQALHYHRLSWQINDSIRREENAKIFAEAQERFEAEKKQNDIDRLSQQKSQLEIEAKLQQVELRRQQLLLIGIFALFILGAIAFYLYQKNVKEQARANQAIMEQKLLRAQMNPHFLFNALNSIQRFYVDGKTKEANDFLADFGMLLRLILDRSSKTMVPIADEIAFLQLYLELEQRRLKRGLNFEIDFDPDEFDYDDTIPSLILQPLVENSIWHGIMKAQKPGFIRISIAREDDQIKCIVKDNGIGYFSSHAADATEHDSKGLALIRQRIMDYGTLNIEELRDSLGNTMGTEARLILKN